MSTFILQQEFPSAYLRIRSYCLKLLPWLGKGLLAVLDQGLVSGSNFLISVLLARWLVPQQYGAYALAFTFFLFLAGFQNALLLEPMSVFGPAAYAKHLSAYLGKLLRLNFVLVLALTGLLVAAAAVVHWFAVDRALPSALWGVSIATPLILFFWLCRRAAYLKLAPALAARAATAYFLVVILLLLVIQRLGWLGSFTAYLIQGVAAFVAAILLLVSLRPQLVSRCGPSSSEVVREHWRYGRWAIATQIVYWVSGNAYYVIAAAFLRMKDVAALRALQNFNQPFGQFVTATGLLLLPWASARFAKEDRAGFQRGLRHRALFLTGMALAYYAILWAVGSRIMGILYAGRYTEFAYLLPFVAAPVVLTAAAQTGAITLQAMQRPSEVFFAYALAGFVTIAVGVPLTRIWGLNGAAMGVPASYLTFFVVVSYRSQVRLRQGLAIKN
jgi:O-antigen/teichoic acid export membrane protein